MKKWIRDEYKPTTVLDKWWSTNSPFSFSIHKGWDKWNYGEGKYIRMETRHLYDANGDLVNKVATPEVEEGQEHEDTDDEEDE